MKSFYKFLFLSMLILISNLHSESIHPEIDYKKEFGKSYDRAIDFIEFKKEILISEIRKANGDPEILVPVIFPEIVRYNLLRDKMEIIALEIFYVNLGKDYSNFSVGPFQMKPSFAEKIEVIAIKQPKLSPTLFKVIKNQKSETKKTRRERLIRLNDLEWQIQYLAAFEKIVNQNFPELLKETTSQRMEFFSMAYNAGFDLSKDEIVNRGKKPSFPYGRVFRENKFLYSDVALFFYSSYWEAFVDSRK